MAGRYRYYKLSEEQKRRKREREKQRRLANLEAFKQRDREYHAANRDRVRLRQAAYNARPKNKARAKAWREANKDRLALVRAAYVAANPEKVKAAQERWRKANPHVLRLHALNRYAREKAGGGKLSRDLPEYLFFMQLGRCAICGCDLEISGFELDHIIPLTRGGAHADSNIQLLCPPCNRRKKNADPVEYLRKIGRSV